MYNQINAPRNHVHLLGYTLASGMYDGRDCIWYEKGNDITFESSHIIIDGGLWFVSSIALIAWIVFLIMLICSTSPIGFLIGLLINTVFIIYSINIVSKLLF